jgi:hypothetical protein
VTDYGLDRRASSQLALDDAEDAAFLAGDEDSMRAVRTMAAVSLVDIAALDLAADELLGILNDLTQGVTVIGIAGQSLGMQHELAARGTGVGGDDRDLDAELVRSRGLTFADTLGLGGVEGIQLQAALALLLAPDPTGARQRKGKRRLDVHMGGDLAADVTDQPAQARAQDAQLPTVAVELLGVGVAPLSLFSPIRVSCRNRCKIHCDHVRRGDELFGITIIRRPQLFSDFFRWLNSLNTCAR